VIKNQAGVLNLTTIGTVANSVPSDPSDGLAGPAALGALTLADLAIADGALVYEDRSVGPPATSYAFDQIQARIRDVGIGQTLALDISARLAGSDDPLTLTATTGPLAAETILPGAIDGWLGVGANRVKITGAKDAAGFLFSVRSERLDLRELLSLARRVAPEIPAELDLSGPGEFVLTIHPRDDTFELEGRIVLDASRVQYGASFTKPERIPLSTTFAATVRSGDSPSSFKAALKIGSSDLAVQGSLAGFAAPKGSLTLSSSNLDLAEILPPAGAAAVGSSRAEKESTPSGSLGGPTASAPPDPVRAASVRIAIDAKRVSGPAMPELKNVKGSMLWERGALTLKDVTMALYGGTATVAGRVDPFAASPTFDLDATVDRFQLADALAQYTSLGDFVVGRLSGRLGIAGSGSTWAVLAPTLNGQGTLEVTDGALRTFNVVRELLAAVDAEGANRLAERPDTPFQRLAAAIEIRDGALRLKDARLVSGEFGATASGVVGLDTSVDLRAEVSLPQASAGALAKTALGAALTRDDGRLHVPIRLSGRLPRPTITLDRNAALGEAGQRLRQRANEKLRELLDQPGQEGAPSPRDLLKGLLKR
jgi:hypothetical protein